MDEESLARSDLNSSRFLDSKVVLESKELVLRPLKPSDADDLYEACQDPEIIRWTTIPQPYERAHAEGFVTNPPEHIWAITIPEFNDRWCGSIEVRIPQNQQKPVDLGYMLAPWARGRGLMAAGVKLVKDYLFNQGFEKIDIRVYPQNTASRKTALNAGFIFREIVENAETQRGELRDIAIYSAVK